MKLTPNQSAKSNLTEFSVSELAVAIKNTLETGFSHVSLRGEVSGYRGPHASGHCYFAIKDNRAKIDAVIWRGVFGKLKIKPEEGMQVTAKGRVTTYPNSSKYQIIIETIEPAGLGALMALLEQRKKKLAGEGLFDESRKQLLPFLPRVVGIITSLTGAVLRDMMHGFNERCPTHVILWPVHVQGENSAAEVASAICGFNQMDGSKGLARPNVIIVARGGGSLEDLWSFNEECVVRAVAESKIPLISAVGHETDWTLIDLVADARAPTPTKAAEWAVPKFSDIAAQTENFAIRLKSTARRYITTAKINLRAAIRGLMRPQDLIALPQQRFDSVEQRLTKSVINAVQAHNIGFMKVINKLNTSTILARIQNMQTRLFLLQHRNKDVYLRIININRNALVTIATRISAEFICSRITQSNEYLVAVTTNLHRSFRQHITNKRTAIEQNNKLLVSLGYQSVLARGFAVVRSYGGQTIKTRHDITNDMFLQIEFYDGKIGARALHDTKSCEHTIRTSKLKKVQHDNKCNNDKINDEKESGQGSLF
ncbi:MAG: exodeoxyribonuclease VII large subunit [Hyphomicrobiaceae bacterium]|nr:exodeoxyribonuclease VII large subunit [Hyphomicrobiaceae bacterium]